MNESRTGVVFSMRFFAMTLEEGRSMEQMVLESLLLEEGK